VPPSSGKRRIPRLNEPSVETSFGLKVRSQYEKEAAEYFKQNNIEFQYEPLMLIGGRQFRPDFYLPGSNLFIEICGYNHMPHYRDRINEKKRLYQNHGLKAVFIDYDGKGSLKKLLTYKLAENDVCI